MIKLKKIDILDGIELKEATFNNNTFPIHFHDTYSIGIINNGIENIRIKDNTLIATAQTVVIFNQNELHANSFYNNENWTYQTLNLNIDALNFLHKEANGSANKDFTFRNSIQDEYLYNALAHLHQSPAKNPDKQIKEIASHLFKNHIVEKAKDTVTYPEWKNIISEIKAFFDEHFDQKINIENLAKKYRKSTFQVIRAFKMHVGLTPIAYLTLIRLNQSKLLLIQGNNLIDIAISCGFFDQSHFANQFKKYFGITPKQYCENYSVVKTR